MRNSNLNSSGGWDKDPYEAYGLSEEQTLIAQERMYIVTHMEEISNEYANYIYDELVKQNPQIASSSLEIAMGGGRRIFVLDVVKKCSVFCEGVFVLCNPENGEPSVVVDIYDFLPNNNPLREIQALLEHIESIRIDVERSTFGMGVDAAKKVGIRAGKHYAQKGSNYLLKQSERLGSLSYHYDSGHKTQMRINRSYRGKANQQKALVNLIEKSKKYGKYAARYEAGGKLLGFLAKKSSNPLKALKPVSFSDIITSPTPIPNGKSTLEIETEESNILAIEALGVYCKKHNNYNLFINQTYLSQGKL